jgi:hypothetical protein
MTQIKNDNPDIARCAAFVLGLPEGLRCTAIAELMKVSKDKTNRLLAINRQLGVLKLSGATWVDPQFYDALRLNAADRTRLLKRVAYHKREPKKRAVVKLALGKWPSAHIVGDKKNARSINVNAPNSVWQYADFV